MRTVPQDLIRNRVYCVNYVEYVGESGLPEYFYIAVRQDDMESFKAALHRGNFDAEDYGMILEQGSGSAPQAVRERMRVLYKCNHANAVKLVK